MNTSSTRDAKKQHEELLRKAALVEQLVKSEGWEIVMQVVNRLHEQEVRALMGQALDHQYYKRIGFVQVLKYLTDVANILKDRKVREYLLHQGRSLGFETFKKVPQYFFEGRAQSREQMARLFGSEVDPKKFHSSVYKQQG